jgi:hypothetical protein
VQVIALAPKSQAEWIFNHAEFPSLKDAPTDAMLKGYLNKYAKEDYLSKLADFNLISYMASKATIPEKTLNEVCQAIKTKTALSRETLNALDAIFASKGWV